MRQFLIFLLFSLVITSCQKKDVKVKVIKNIKDVEEMFQLKNYKTQVRMASNDSTDHITAQLGDFTLSGDIDTKLNCKTGIWSLKNRTDSKEIQIDYIAFDKNDVFKNQIVFKEHNKIDSSASKFYITKDKNPKELVLKFFSPKMKDELSKEAKVGYRIYRGSKRIKDDSIIYKDAKEGKYLSKINFTFKKGDKIVGSFSEFVTSKSSRSKDSLIMGNNTIYFIEKIE